MKKYIFLFVMFLTACSNSVDIVEATPAYVNSIDCITYQAVNKVRFYTIELASLMDTASAQRGFEANVRFNNDVDQVNAELQSLMAELKGLEIEDELISVQVEKLIEAIDNATTNSGGYIHIPAPPPGIDYLSRANGSILRLFDLLDQTSLILPSCPQ